MFRSGISRLALLAGVGCLGTAAFVAAQERREDAVMLGGANTADAASETLAALGPIGEMVGRNFTFCTLNKGSCIESSIIAAAVRQNPDGSVTLDFSNDLDEVHFRVDNGVGMGGLTKNTVKPLIRTEAGVRVNGIVGAGYEFVREGDDFGMIHHSWVGKSHYRFYAPDYETPRVAKRLAMLDAKMGPPGTGPVPVQPALRSAAVSADRPGAAPLIAQSGSSPRGQSSGFQTASLSAAPSGKFGVWQQMSGQTWEFSHDDNGVRQRCFVAVLLDDASREPAIPYACESGDRGRWKITPSGSGFSVGATAYTILPDGAATSGLKVEGKTQSRSVMRMVAPGRVEIFQEQAKANSKKPKWVRSSEASNTYTPVDQQTVGKVLAAGPRRIAAAREALIPQQWSFLADLPGKVEIGMTSNAGQRATMALNVRREPGTMLLRNAEWIERGRSMRINYTSGNGISWNEQFTRTGPNAFDVVHKGPNGEKRYKARLVKDQFNPIPQLVMQLGAMPCGQAKRTLSRVDHNGQASYSDYFTGICRGGEYGGFSSPSPTSDNGAGTTFYAYTPANLKSWQGQLAGIDKIYDQSDRDYVANEKRDAIEKRRQARIAAQNKARMDAVIMNGLAGIAGAVAQGRQDAQRQIYETERNVAAYTALGIAKRAEATGQPLDARAFNTALESALKGTVRQSVIDGMRVSTGSSSRSGSGQGSGASGSAEGGRGRTERGDNGYARSTTHSAGGAGDASSGSAGAGSGDASDFDQTLARLAERQNDRDGADKLASGSGNGSSGSSSSSSATLVVSTGEKDRARQAQLDAEAAKRKADWDAREAADQARYAAQRAEEKRKAEANKPKTDCNGRPIGSPPPAPQYDKNGNRVASVCRY